MSNVPNLVALDEATGGLRLGYGAHNITLHPLWLRERVCGNAVCDAISGQRLYEHSELGDHLSLTAIAPDKADQLTLTFNSGESFNIYLPDTLRELGWIEDPEALPHPESWDSALTPFPRSDWQSLDDPDNLRLVLNNYFTYGFCVFENTPTQKDNLKTLARRFGYLRETNFGELFNVQTKPSPTDLAYTDVALASHTDNPYRAPIPGIQFLHCLRNEVSGGLSTLVDGIKIAEDLRSESPDQADILEQVQVRFRYQGPSAILEHHGPLIERDHTGTIRQIRLSSRLDFVPALDHATLVLFYAGRKRLHAMSQSQTYQIKFPFKPGTLLMMDNYRLLHGRTAFNGAQGHRHLQGCYIDHDGPASLYRMLARDGQTSAVGREI